MNSYMKVHGVSEGKEVTLSLTMHEIAALGIDPWRLDLMDPEPVVANIRGREIAFSKLSNVVFAYKVGDTMFVGAHDGKKGVCFYGDANDSTENQVYLRNFKVSTTPFGEHFAQYLLVAPNYTVTEPKSLSSSMVFCGPPGSGKSAFVAAMAAMALGETVKSKAQSSYLPRPFSDLQVEGNQLHYSALSGLRPRIFTGTMLETRSFQGFELPGYINQVHTTFGAWSPVVRGSCLFRAILGVESQRVDFSVAVDHLEPVKAFVTNRLEGAEAIQAVAATVFARMQGQSGKAASFVFKYEGRVYQVWTDGNEMDAQRTIDALASESVNQVRGTRIAFQDLAQRQLRCLQSGGLAKLLDLGQPEGQGLKRVEPEHLPDGDATTSNKEESST